MKILLKICVLVFVITGLSCKEVSKDNPATAPEDKETSNLSKIEEQCYLYAKNNDSIKLTLKENKTIITGKLVYNFYEKDGSHGAFEGIMKGDTLYGDYDFEAEGTKSKREMIFLKNGNMLLQGHGDVEVDGQNTVVFKKGAKITFDEEFTLTAVECEKLNL